MKRSMKYEVGSRKKEGKRKKEKGKRKKYWFLSFILYPLSFYYLLLTSYFLLPTVVWASDLKITAKVDRDTITVGDPIIYTISIAAAKGVIIKPPTAKVNVYPFEVLNYNFDEKLLSRPAGVDEKIITIEYTVSAYNIGEYDIPPIEITYTDESGVEKQAATEIQAIKVKGILPEGAKDLKDIKGPLSLKVRDEKGEVKRGKLVLIFSLFLLIAFAVSFAFLILRKKKKAVEAPQPMTPTDIALKELGRLKEFALFGKGEFKRLYTLLADIIRHFIAAKFNIDAERRTSSEIVEEFKGIHSLNGQGELLADFFSDCDIVKFSRYNPTEEEARLIVKKAEEIISNF